MRRILLSSLLLFLMISCSGKTMDLPYLISFEQSSSVGNVHMIDRKIISYELDLRSPTLAILRIKIEDKIQIGTKIITVPWDVSISLQEGKSFKILR